MKPKVIIIPETHCWDKTFAGRLKYVEEILSYLQIIIDRVNEMIARGDTAYIIFMGDVTHKGFKDVGKLVSFVSLIGHLHALVEGRLYSLIGNHELSFPQGNPYWMVANHQSMFHTMYRNLEGYGVFSQGINIVDELIVGNTLYIFGHYNRKSFDYDYSDYDRVILLTHNSIMDGEIRNTLEEVYHRDPKAAFVKYMSLRETGMIPLTNKLSHVFIGHMHMAYSHFRVKEYIQGCDMDFELRYLASLGRTNHTEISNSDLERIIPIISEDSNMYDDFKIKLWPRESCINEDEIVTSQAKRQQQKTLDNLKASTIFSISPIETIRTWLQEDAYTLQLFEAMVINEPCISLDELLLEVGE